MVSGESARSLSRECRQFLDENPGVRLARPEDNAELLAFLAQVPMKSGDLEILYSREPDYFAGSQEQGSESYTIVFEHADGSIAGTAGLHLRTAWLDGAAAQVAYLGDLRISPRMGVRGRKMWRQFYSSLLRSAPGMPELASCKLFFTAVFDENRVAVRALTSGKTDFEYSPISPYRSVQILGRWRLHPARFLAPLRKPAFSLSWLGEADKAELARFVEQVSRRRPLGVTPEELERRLASWREFNLTHFLVARDAAGAVVACVAPWRGSRRRLLARTLSRRLRSYPFGGARWGFGESRKTSR